MLGFFPLNPLLVYTASLMFQNHHLSPSSGFSPQTSTHDTAPLITIRQMDIFLLALTEQNIITASFTSGKIITKSKFIAVNVLNDPQKAR